MIYALLLMWHGYEGAGNTQLIEGFQSYQDCNTAYLEIVKQKPKSYFRDFSGVCMQVKDVR